MLLVTLYSEILLNCVYPVRNSFKSIFLSFLNFPQAHFLYSTHTKYFISNGVNLVVQLAGIKIADLQKILK